MFFKKIKNKQFDYFPRFYNPAEDKDLKRKQRLRFSVNSKVKRKNKSPFMLLLFVILIIYFIIRLSNM
jgi:hypothetical protein